MSDAKPATGGALPAGKLSLALRSFYGNQPDPELVGWLYRYTQGCVEQMQPGAANEQPHWRGTEDIAADFLAFLRQKGMPLETPGYFRYALGRYLVKSQSPAGHELWNLLSRALSVLRRAKKVWRLDGPDDDGTRNSNDVVWTAYHTPAGRRLGDPARREIAARALPRIRPTGAGRYYDRSPPRIIKPRQARQLALDLLRADESAVTMGALNDLAQRCVFILREEPVDPVPEPGEIGSPLSRSEAEPVFTPAVEARLLEEAAAAARTIWPRLPEDLQEVFCRYLMPAYFFGASAVLRDLGDPSHVHRQKNRLAQIIAETLPPPEDFCRNDAALRLHGRMVATALEQIFLRRCRKTGGSDATPS